jgi:hypothetical protein
MWIVVMLAIGLSGCLEGSDESLPGASSSDANPEGQVTLQLVWPDSAGAEQNGVAAAAATLPANVVTIRITVTSPSTGVNVAIDIQAGAGSGHIGKLPPAADYGIEVSALAQDGTILFSGVAINVTVQAGRKTAVIITMQPVTTGGIDVSW